MSAKRKGNERTIMSCVILLDEMTKTGKIKDFVLSLFFL